MKNPKKMTFLGSTHDIVAGLAMSGVGLGPNPEGIDPEEVADTIADELDERGIDFLEIGLWGSRAKRTANIDSDWDFYVILPDEEFDSFTMFGRVKEFWEIEKEVAEEHGLEPHGADRGGRPRVLDLTSHSGRWGQRNQKIPILEEE